MNAPVTKPLRLKRKTKADEQPTIKAIKGMDMDMSCRGHKFEIGQTYTVEGNINACKNGFYSYPVDDDTPPHAVFEYYAPGTSRFFEVDAGGKTDRDGNKIASASLTISAEISIGEIARRVAEWCVNKAQGAATNSGDSGAATNSGNRGAATNSGDYGAATNSGDYGAAFSHAFGSKVMCEGDGQALYCTEFADDGSIASVACGITGRDGIKAGVWYHAKDGKLVEVAQ